MKHPASFWNLVQTNVRRSDHRHQCPSRKSQHCNEASPQAAKETADRRSGEPSLLGGRFAAATKTASKAQSAKACFIRCDIGFRRCLAGAGPRRLRMKDELLRAPVGA